jgi:putative phosphoesterase
VPRRILLISDTHGFSDPALLTHAQEADEIWHGGDIGPVETISAFADSKPFRAVYGNIDGPDVRKRFPEHLHFECESVKVYMTHIGGYPGRYPARIRQTLIEEKPDLFICGHSHILKVIYDKELNFLHINPGAAGRQGMQVMRTAIRFVIVGKEIKELAIIELGKRGK